ncbi:MAG: hypothetical protein K2X27_01845, partial [Candidatus Obscuribacterales bacterium]|nr:hypothetical protein [Candidatus Obscuribacterales bacterium]
NNQSVLSPQEAAGLGYLLDHIKKNPKSKDKLQSKEKSDPLEAILKGKKLQALEGVLDPRSMKTLQALQMNNFESLFNAFVEMIEDPESFKAKSPFDNAANVLDSTDSFLKDLDMEDEHAFTRSELLIISKLSPAKDKKPLSFIAKHFDAFVKAFFLPGKARKKDINSSRNVFQGLSFVREHFDFEKATISDLQIREYLRQNQHLLQEKDKRGLADLLSFMETHAR